MDIVWKTGEGHSFTLQKERNGWYLYDEVNMNGNKFGKKHMHYLTNSIKYHIMEWFASETIYDLHTKNATGLAPAHHYIHHEHSFPSEDDQPPKLTSLDRRRR